MCDEEFTYNEKHERETRERMAIKEKESEIMSKQSTSQQ